MEPKTFIQQACNPVFLTCTCSSGLTRVLPVSLYNMHIQYAHVQWNCFWKEKDRGVKIYPCLHFVEKKTHKHFPFWLQNLFKKDPPSNQVKEGIALALGAVIYTYCQTPGNCQHQVRPGTEFLISRRLRVFCFCLYLSIGWFDV